MIAQFEPARYNDPELARFAQQQVEIAPDAALSGVQARVEAHTADGSTVAVTCDHPRGAPERPLSRAEVEAKFRTYASARLSRDRVEEAIGLVARLEALGSTRRLMDILRADR